MDLYRSRDMKYISLTITNESSYNTIYHIGKFSKLHIVDLNANSNTQEVPHKNITLYKKKIVDITSCEKLINTLYNIIQQYNINNNISYSVSDIDPQGSDVLDYVNNILQPIQNEINLSQQFLQENINNINNLIERKYLLQALLNINLYAETQKLQNDLTRNITQQTHLLSPQDNDTVIVDELESGFNSNNNNNNETIIANNTFRRIITGTIITTQQLSLQRSIYRISRGNAICKFIPLDYEFIDPITNDKLQKSIFYIIILGELLYDKLYKICDLIMYCNIININTTDRSQYNMMIKDIEQQIDEQYIVQNNTKQQITNILTKLTDNGYNQCPLRNYEYALKTEKSICDVYMKSYYYLTMMSLEGWCPTEELNNLQICLKHAVNNTGQPIAALEIDPLNPINKNNLHPPTYFITNKFTTTYQAIVDTYGVPRYKEINPGLFTIITFPYLFGIMYGDIGHGLLLTIGSLLLIKYEKQLQSMIYSNTLGEIPSMAFNGRYVLVSMGLFAIYCGIIYNDCFSIPLAFYDTGFIYNNNTETYNFNGYVYPLGLDWSWAHTTNELAFFNSFKMKMSVTIGVTQMLFGIILSSFNHLYFNDYISIYFEFIPRLIFMCSTFGYMIFMILLKWIIDWSQTSISPPNLIQTMIAMFLSPGSIEPDKLLYNGQSGFQSFLLFCALVSVPIMLVGKPYANKYKHKKHIAAKHIELIKKQTNQQLNNDFQLIRNSSNNITNNNNNIVYSPQSSPGTDNDIEVNVFELPQVSSIVDNITTDNNIDYNNHNISQQQHNNDNNNEHGHSFSDEMIHQAIHTIEFVLGCVSNTASYLRLWALSLAHAELSSVFWDKMIIQYGIEGGSAIGAFIGFALWAAATGGVLLAMDVLECFLHALRLHWVEFQSKFYNADGYAFEGFSFQQHNV